MLKLVLILFISCSLYATQDRVALIIGNNAYDGENALFNPVNDTDLIVSKLQKSNFKIIYEKDASLMRINKAIKKFKKSLTTQSVGLFYFAGHGVEIDGSNYLVPIDAKFTSEDSLKQTSLKLDKLVRVFNEAKNDLNIIILDACRNNPLAPLKKRGLAPFISPDGLFVAYSAQSGHKALDGPSDGNSPFAAALAQNMLSAGNIESVFKQTRIDVYNATHGKQRPSTYSEILAPFYFIQERQRGLKHKKTAKVDFKRHKRYIEPALVLVKAGSFTMGNNDEFETSPAHKVTIEKDFFVSAYEVTFEEYDLFCENSGWQKADDNDWGRGKQPLINVTWNDANEYVKWLSKKSRKHYRLLSEAEWEYVAKSGTNSSYGYGNDDGLASKYIWYEDNANGHPHNIGKKMPNSFGVHDMLGNVAEWTQNSNYSYSDSEYLQALNNLDEKVVRGGSCYGSYDEITTYQRVGMNKNKSNKYTGFRIALDTKRKNE